MTTASQISRQVEAPPLPQTPDVMIPVVGAAILRSFPVEAAGCLVARRGAQVSNAGCWEFPGGKVEHSEHPRQALKREIREELGLDIEVGNFLARGMAGNSSRRIVLDVYEARIMGGDLRLTDHDAWLWIGAENLHELTWAEADRPILPHLQARLRALKETSAKAAVG